MADVKSNLLPKVIVGGVLVTAILVGLKSCSGDKPAEKPTEAQSLLAAMSPEELRALGVEGDTPEDTLRTLIGTLRTTRTQQAELQGTIDKVLKENEALRKRSTNVSGQVNEAVAGVRKQAEQSQQQLRQEQQTLTGKLQALTEQLAGSTATAKTSGDSDIPLGLGLDGLGSGDNRAAPGADGLLWVTPVDMKEADPRSAGSSKTGPTFPTSFLEDNALTRQKAAYEQQVKGHTNEKGAQENADPVYTLPENATLVGSRAMTALLGRVPVNGTVTDPYPFKLMIGKDNLTANGIELPDVEGAIVSGTASGDWTLSCVRGQVNSITFVFADGTVRTLPKPNTNVNAGNSSGSTGKDISTTAGIGWISDDNGIPCISGERKSNASTYLPTIAALSAASAAGEGISQGQYTTQNNVNGITSTMTGDAGQAVLGKALSGGMKETADWVRERYGMMFDAVYVPPGQKLAVHITRQLAIDYEGQGRKVRYDDFSLPDATVSGGLD